MKCFNRHRLSETLGALFLVGLATTLFLTIRHVRHERRILAEALAETRERASRAARTIDEYLSTTPSLSQALVEELERGVLTGDNAVPRFEQLLREQPHILGFGIFYEPHAWSPRERLYSRYVLRHQGRPLQVIDVGKLYDYTEPKHEWYFGSLLEGARWSEPLQGRASQALIVTYSAPFRQPGAREGLAPSEPIGVVVVSYTSDELARTVNQLGLRHAGYAFLVSPQGRFIAHPDRRLTQEGRSIYELAWEHEDVALQALAIRALQGSSAFIEHEDPLTGQSSWILFEPIPSVGWSLGVVTLKEGLLDKADSRHGWMWSLVAGSSTLVLLCVLVAAALVRRPRWALWGASVAVSLVLALGVGLTWLIERHWPSYTGEVVGRVADEPNLQDFLNEYEAESTEAGREPPLRVPTAVFIESLDFSSAYEVKVTGYAWQRYRRGVHDGLSRGLLLPEAMGELRIQQVYTREQGEEELVGFRFDATLRQEFDYDAYPMDRQQIWLRMRHPDLERNVLLVPDFSSYPLTGSTHLPGLAQPLLLPGWRVVGSGFDYRERAYNTTFGFASRTTVQEEPELHYTLQIERHFTSPFIVRILPLCVVGCMLFGILLISSKRGRRAAWFGFTAKDVVLGNAALFFVVIFDHAALRQSLASPRIIYMEWFYLLMYLSLLGVTLNSLLFATGRIRLLEVGDNLLPKVLFGPAYLAAIFAITVAVFY